MWYDIFMQYAGSLPTGCFAGHSIEVKSGYLLYKLSFSSRGLEYEEYMRDGALVHSHIIPLEEGLEGYEEAVMVVFPNEFLVVSGVTNHIHVLNHDRVFYCDESAEILRDPVLMRFNTAFNVSKNPTTLLSEGTYLFKSFNIGAMWSYYDGVGHLNINGRLFYYPTGGTSKCRPSIAKDWQGRLWLSDADDPSKRCGFPYCLNLL